MSRRRWIADEVSGNRAALTGEHAEHLSRVLRARVGQQFEIATGENVRRGHVTRIDHGRVEFELGDEIIATATPNVTLALSIFKFDRMEWAIEKCTELGATRIVPVIASRTETHLAAAAPKRVERWQRIALQASEQSRHNSPPQIDQPLKLTAAVALPGTLRIRWPNPSSKQCSGKCSTPILHVTLSWRLAPRVDGLSQNSNSSAMQVGFQLLSATPSFASKPPP